MINDLAAPRARRLPALLLVACLLVGTAAAVPYVPVHDDASDGMRSYGSTHAQLVRAPQLRATPPAGFAPDGLAAAVPSAPNAGRAREAVGAAPAVVVPRTMARLSPLSRAPPAAN